jgi:hypothetical protein
MQGVLLFGIGLQNSAINITGTGKITGIMVLNSEIQGLWNLRRLQIWRWVNRGSSPSYWLINNKILNG